jgi:hypothetical protein
MPENLDPIDALAAELFELDADNEDTSTGSDSSESGTPPSDTPAEGSSPPANDAGTTDTEDASLQELLARRKQEHPELADTVDAIYKELQGGYTKKFQTLAEQRKQLEGVDLTLVDTLRQFQQLSPAQQVQWLEYQADLLKQSQAQDPNPQESEFAEVEGILPDWLIEEIKLNRMSRVEQQKAKIAADIERSFTALQNEVGREIPPEEREHVFTFLTKRNLAVEDIPWVYRALNFDKAEKIGIEKARQIREQKETAPQPPSSTAVRSGSASEEWDTKAALQSILGR